MDRNCSFIASLFTHPPINHEGRDGAKEEIKKNLRGFVPSRLRGKERGYDLDSYFVSAEKGTTKNGMRASTSNVFDGK